MCNKLLLWMFCLAPLDEFVEDHKDFVVAVVRFSFGRIKINLILLVLF